MKYGVIQTQPMKYGVIQTQPIKYRVFRALTEVRCVEDSDNFLENGLEEVSRQIFVLEAPSPASWLLFKINVSHHFVTTTDTWQSARRTLGSRNQSYNLWLKPANLSYQTLSTRIVLYTTSCSTSFLTTGRLVIARSNYCCLCFIVPECSCFICPNKRLFSAVGQVFQHWQTACLSRSLNMILFLLRIYM